MNVGRHVTHETRKNDPFLFSWLFDSVPVYPSLLLPPPLPRLRLDYWGTCASVCKTKYTVVNRDTGELYDVREIDTSMPYRYSVLPHNMRVPSKARQLLGINEQPTHVPPKAAKVTSSEWWTVLCCIVLYCCAMPQPQQRQHSYDSCWV